MRPPAYQDNAAKVRVAGRERKHLPQRMQHRIQQRAQQLAGEGLEVQAHRVAPLADRRHHRGLRGAPAEIPGRVDPKLRLDRRLIRRRGWIGESELARELSGLPDIAHKGVTLGEAADEREVAAGDAAQSAGESSTTP